MKIRILKISIVVCLIFWAAFSAVWIRSYFALDVFVWTNVDYFHGMTAGRAFRLQSTHGGQWWGCESVIDPHSGAMYAPLTWHLENQHLPYPTAVVALKQMLPTQVGWERFGFGFGCDTIVIGVGPAQYSFVMLELPDWFASFIWLALAIPLIRWLRKHQRDVTGNLCVKCGYDLRASPERCPECGVLPVRKAQLKL